MELKALQDFSWAHRGVQIEEFKEGQTITTEDEDLIRVAKEEGWASEDGQKPVMQRKKSAPENKDAGAAPENK